MKLESANLQLLQQSLMSEEGISANPLDKPLASALHASKASQRDYNDINALQGLKNADANSPEALREVAEQFESLFISMMLKSMREANAVFEQDSPFSSNESKMYRDMFDSQLSVSMAQGKGIGLADSLVRQLSQRGSSFAPNVEAGAADLPQGASNNLMDRYVQSLVRKAKDQEMQATRALDALEAASEGLAVAQDPQEFATPADFIEYMKPFAEQAAERLGIDPKVLVAQSALETGWGKHMIKNSDGGSSFNFFGIKADRRWDGDVAVVQTLEYRQGIAAKEQASFRSYPDIAASLNDYVDFLQENGRYQGALEKVTDSEQFLQKLQQAGYATDPQYAQKIISISKNAEFSRAFDR